jgi:carbamoyl-phosphate synthase large subunit
MKGMDELKKLNINTFIPTLQQYEERHKANLPDFGKKYQVNVPDSFTVTSPGDLKEIKNKFDFPVVIKGKFYDAYIARSLEQAEMYFQKISAKWGVPVIIQEFVKGTEVNVVALGDGEGNTVAAVPMRKQYITDAGKAWAGISLDDKKNA